MKGRPFLTLRESIHSTATMNGPMKELAPQLDWSPSELSMRVTLGGDSARPFPADDEHLIQIQRITGDYSILFTMAELLGYELQPKKDRWPELVKHLQADVQDLTKRLQLVLDLRVDPPKGKR